MSLILDVDDLVRPADEPVNLIPVIDAVNAAKRADPEIDREMMRLAYFQERRWIGATCDCCEEGRHLDLVWVDRVTNKWATTGLTGYEFTGSRDAIHALIAKRTPKYHCTSGWEAPDPHGVRRYFARLTHDRKPRDTEFKYARSEPLALCAAFLYAEFLEAVAANEGKS